MLFSIFLSTPRALILSWLPQSIQFLFVVIIQLFYIFIFTTTALLIQLFFKTESWPPPSSSSSAVVALVLEFRIHCNFIIFVSGLFHWIANISSTAHNNFKYSSNVIFVGCANHDLNIVIILYHLVKSWAPNFRWDFKWKYSEKK